MTATSATTSRRDGGYAALRGRTPVSTADRTAAWHRTAGELTAFLPTLQSAPRDVGSLELVVRRPAPAEREVLEEGELDLVVGLVGDSWSTRPSSRTEDGRAHPDMQLTVMSSAVIGFLAGDIPGGVPWPATSCTSTSTSRTTTSPRARCSPSGTSRVGGAVVEVTDQPHRGCAKFVHRFGAEAMRAVNGPAGPPESAPRVSTPGSSSPAAYARAIR